MAKPPQIDSKLDLEADLVTKINILITGTEDAQTLVYSMSVKKEIK